MPIYKFTRVYEVEAPTKEGAMELCKQHPAEYQVYESSTVKTAERKSWGDSFKKQVTGK